jgi:hypothetical protein
MWKESAYTTSVLRKSPSPTPTTSRPAINIPRLEAPASRAAPRANPADPIPTARVRPIVSEREPAHREATVADRRTDETTIPPIVEVNSPNWSVNCTMVITGPMTPVSNLEARYQNVEIFRPGILEAHLTHSKGCLYRRRETQGGISGGVIS